MRPYILAECNYKNLQDRDIDLAVLPWGAVEAHNYHLPYAADIIESDNIAAEAAEKADRQGANLIVFPTIPYGVNTGQTDIKLDMNMNPSTQSAILHDMLTVLNRQKIYKFCILNSHGGNNFKPILRELGLQFPQMFLSFCNWFNAIEKTEIFSHGGDHADEMETSLLLYLTPELVLPLTEAGSGREKQIKIKGIREGWAWTERQWSKATEDTGIGNPADASAEKGKTYFKAITDKVAELFVEIARADINDLYE
ncbi:MAG: creatininase family protein [Caldithrix sp.]|nr:creatininase family protein [Caldithrix sp.]